MRRFDKQKTIHPVLSVIIFLLIIATGVGVYFIPEHSTLFLLSFLIPLILIIAFAKRLPLSLGVIARVLVGCLFIFSGFVKGVDPIGTVYQIHDYLTAYNMPEWIMNFSLVMALILNFTEFITGIMLLFNIKIKISLVLASLMMIFFTIVTTLDATFSLVADCGCFGEAIKLTAWQTVYKNLTLNLFVIIMWFTLRKMKPTFYPSAEIGIATFFGILFMGLQTYSLALLPPIDFRDWKVGNDMKSENPVPIEYKVKYQNITTFEDAVMDAKDIPYSDSLWMEEWTFVDQIVIDKNVYPHTLMLFSAEEENETAHVVYDPKPNIYIVSCFIDDVDIEKYKRLLPLIDFCHQKGYNVYFITASVYEDYEHLAETLHLDAYFYNADDTELKAMIRSNPGIVAMQNGIVKKKWSINNVPTIEKFTAVFQ